MNRKKILKYIRIIVYIIILLGLLWLKLTDNTLGECFIKTNFGIQCPSCGITRATKSILNLDFASAITYNSYFVFVLLPIFLIFLVDDIFCICTNKKSFVDIIFGE